MTRQQHASLRAFPATVDNSAGFTHSPQLSTGRPQVRLWIGGELKLRLSSPAAVRSSARNENTPQGWFSRGVAAVWRRVVPATHAPDNALP